MRADRHQLRRGARFARAARCVAALALASPATALANEGAAATPSTGAQYRAEQSSVDDAARARVRLSALVDMYAEQSRHSRRWLDGTSIGLGVSALGASVAVTLRERSLPGLTLGLQGVFGVTSGLYGLVSDGPFDRLRGTIEQSRALGRSDAATLEYASLEWDRLADRERSRRKVLGTVETAVGTLLTASALVLAVAPPERVGMTNFDRALTTSLMAGFGAAHVLGGVAALVQPSPVEQAREMFRAGDTARAGVSVGVSPAGMGQGCAVSIRGAW
jgi:hypothetical protein